MARPRLRILLPAGPDTREEHTPLPLTDSRNKECSANAPAVILP